MWVRRSPEQIRGITRRRRFSPVGPIFLALLVSFFWLVLGTGGYVNRFGAPHLAQPVSAGLRLFPAHFLLGFLLFYIGQVLLRGWGGGAYAPEAFICERCQKVQTLTSTRTCICGGPLEPLRNWRWIENEVSSNQAMQRTAPRSDA